MQGNRSCGYISISKCARSEGGGVFNECAPQQPWFVVGLGAQLLQCERLSIP